MAVVDAAVVDVDIADVGAAVVAEPDVVVVAEWLMFALVVVVVLVVLVDNESAAEAVPNIESVKCQYVRKLTVYKNKLYIIDGYENVFPSQKII